MAFNELDQGDLERLESDAGDFGDTLEVSFVPKGEQRIQVNVAEKCLLGARFRLPPSNEQEPAGEPVGIVCLKSNPPHLAHHRWTDISIDVAREHRGKGYGAEAIRWALWYSFQITGLHRVQLGAFSVNGGAMKLYEKLGFQEEGRQRNWMWFNGGWHDHVLYGMLEDEWWDMQRKAGKKV
ncbi:GNAT family acetyltransferase [Hypoxylon sp. FL1150]|nr:GNAT family acetyltransferase [Hypoxylon sp. FL1150]